MSSYGLQHRKGEQIRIAANREQLWTVALKASNERVVAKQNREQLWTAVSKLSKRRAMKGLQLITSNERIAANCEQLWTATSKASKGEQ